MDLTLKTECYICKHKQQVILRYFHDYNLVIIEMLNHIVKKIGIYLVSNINLLVHWKNVYAYQLTIWLFRCYLKYMCVITNSSWLQKCNIHDTIIQMRSKFDRTNIAISVVEVDFFCCIVDDKSVLLINQN